MEKKKNLNVIKELDNLVEKMESRGGRFLGFYFNDLENTCSVALTDEQFDHELCAGLASLLQMALEGDGNERMSRLTDIILNAILLIKKSASEASMNYMVKLLTDFTEELKGINSELENFIADNTEHNCGNCEDLRTCNEEQAIKYRKEHGIPRPKKKGRNVPIN